MTAGIRLRQYDLIHDAGEFPELLECSGMPRSLTGKELLFRRVKQVIPLGCKVAARRQLMFRIQDVDGADFFASLRKSISCTCGYMTENTSNRPRSTFTSRPGCTRMP